MEDTSPWPASLNMSTAEGTVSRITVSGSGSRWDVNGLEIARSGFGELHVMDGAIVNAGFMTIGTDEAGHGKVIVDGPASRLNVDSAVIGQHGRGEFTLRNGGLATADQSLIELGGIGTTQVVPNTASSTSARA